MALDFEEVYPPRPYARRKIKTKVDEFTVTAEAIASPVENSLEYGPFELAGNVEINKGTWMRVSCTAAEVKPLIALLQQILELPAAGSSHTGGNK